MSLQFNCTFRRSMHGLQYLIQILVRLVVKKIKILCKVFPLTPIISHGLEIRQNLIISTEIPIYFQDTWERISRNCWDSHPKTSGSAHIPFIMQSRVALPAVMRNSFKCIIKIETSSIGSYTSSTSALHSWTQLCVSFITCCISPCDIPSGVRTRATALKH